MEKRARFKSAWLPYALVAPQVLVSVLFELGGRQLRVGQEDPDLFGMR